MSNLDKHFIFLRHKVYFFMKIFRFIKNRALLSRFSIFCFLSSSSISSFRCCASSILLACSWKLSCLGIEFHCFIYFMLRETMVLLKDWISVGYSKSLSRKVWRWEETLPSVTFLGLSGWSCPKRSFTMILIPVSLSKVRYTNLLVNSYLFLLVCLGSWFRAINMIFGQLSFLNSLFSYEGYTFVNPP